MPEEIHALLVKRDSIERDPALGEGGRGARKIAVTQLYPDSEEPAGDALWSPPSGGSKCPVLVTGDLEIAVFNQNARQDRHYHKQATEIYEVIDGEMSIEVEGSIYRLSAGDTLVVRPGAVHLVLSEGTSFLSRVISTGCGGASDKVIEYG